MQAACGARPTAGTMMPRGATAAISSGKPEQAGQQHKDQRRQPAATQRARDHTIATKGNERRAGRGWGGG